MIFKMTTMPLNVKCLGVETLEKIFFWRLKHIASLRLRMKNEERKKPNRGGVVWTW